MPPSRSGQRTARGYRGPDQRAGGLVEVPWTAARRSNRRKDPVPATRPPEVGAWPTLAQVVVVLAPGWTARTVPDQAHISGLTYGWTGGSTHCQLLHRPLRGRGRGHDRWLGRPDHPVRTGRPRDPGRSGSRRADRASRPGHRTRHPIDQLFAHRRLRARLQRGRHVHPGRRPAAGDLLGRRRHLDTLYLSAGPDRAHRRRPRRPLRSRTRPATWGWPSAAPAS